jgi:cell division protein FtsB
LLVNIEISKTGTKKGKLWSLTCSTLAEKAELFKDYNSLNKEKEKKEVEIKKLEGTREDYNG